MIKYIIQIILIVLTSCSDFLEEYSQDQAYVKGYEDLDELLLGEAYMSRSVIREYQFGANNGAYYPYIHFMGDETEQYLNSTNYLPKASCFTLFGYYTWQQKVIRDPDGGNSWDDAVDWNKLYGHINALNIILSSIDDCKTTTDDDIINVNRIKGEGLFLRAAYYFVLVNLYGEPYSPATAEYALGVPLKNTPYVEDKSYTRNTVAEVYSLIVKNLLDAEKFLENIPQKSIYRIDINGVRLLLSRVFLYMQDYANAKIYAQKVLTKRNILQDLNYYDGDEFLVPTSPEIIFSMGAASIPGNIAVNSICASNNFQVSNDLYNCYEEGDLRTKFYIVKEGTSVYLKKIIGENFLMKDISDVFVLRTSEAYLNLAEAAVLSNDEALAKTTINSLIINRFESDKYDESVVNNLSIDELVYFIRDERRRELCFEGHRWFDLRRYNVVANYPNTKVLNASYTFFEIDQMTYTYIPKMKKTFSLEPNDKAYTLPIPQAELDYNSRMKDNPRDERLGVKDNL